MTVPYQGGLPIKEGTINYEQFISILHNALRPSLQGIVLSAGATTIGIVDDTIIVVGDAGGNTISTITGGIMGQTLTLLFVDALITITDDNTHTINSVDLNSAFISADDKTLMLLFDGISWYEISRSVN